MNTINIGMPPAPLSALYDVKGELGAGACGVVFGGASKQDGTKVAIKVVAVKGTAASSKYRTKMRRQLEAFEAELLKREVEVLKFMNHPNACQLLNSFDDPAAGRLWLVLEMCSGGDLERAIDARGALREEEGRNILHQLCSVCSFMHQSGIVHRDIKPANVMIVDGSPSRTLEPGALEAPARIKLVDFGVGRVLAPAKARRSRSRLSLPRRMIARTRRTDAPSTSVVELGPSRATLPTSSTYRGSAAPASSRIGASSRVGSMVVAESFASDRGSASSPGRLPPSIEYNLSVCGTPMYQPPELSVVERSVSVTLEQAFAIDVFALGRTLLHALTGMLGGQMDAVDEVDAGCGCCGGAPSHASFVVPLSKLSSEAQDTIGQMTRKDWSLRPTMRDCFRLPLLASHSHHSEGVPTNARVGAV